jgi:probable rRNA maturation factor
MKPNPSHLTVPLVEAANQYPGLTFDFSKLQSFFEVVFSVHSHRLQGELSIVFMERKVHSLLHGKYLLDYRPTDVITFPGSAEDGIAGEICVSVDQAMDGAGKYGLTFQEELSLYLIHGWLHLLGFDDIEEIDREIMRLEERKILAAVKKVAAFPDFRLAQDSR